MRFSAVGGRAGLQARVPGLDEMGFSPGGNAWSIYEMGSSYIMPRHKKRSVGIKELKDKASEIVATVQRTGQVIVITKNNQEVAQITPIPKDPYQKLIDAGLILPGPKPRPLCELKLKPLDMDSTPAIQAILQDREED